VLSEGAESLTSSDGSFLALYVHDPGIPEFRMGFLSMEWRPRRVLRTALITLICCAGVILIAALVGNPISQGDGAAGVSPLPGHPDLAGWGPERWACQPGTDTLRDIEQAIGPGRVESQDPLTIVWYSVYREAGASMTRWVWGRLVMAGAVGYIRVKATGTFDGSGVLSDWHIDCEPISDVRSNMVGDSRWPDLSIRPGWCPGPRGFIIID
jgi:hypothetical protein